MAHGEEPKTWVELANLFFHLSICQFTQQMLDIELILSFLLSSKTYYIWPTLICLPITSQGATSPWHMFFDIHIYTHESVFWYISLYPEILGSQQLPSSRNMCGMSLLNKTQYLAPPQWCISWLLACVNSRWHALYEPRQWQFHNCIVPLTLFIGCGRLSEIW